MKTWGVFFLYAVALASAEVFFHETFEDDWRDRWTLPSSTRHTMMGRFEHTAGPYAADASDKGLLTVDEYRHYRAFADVESFDTKGRTLVLQYSLRFTKDMECAGTYLKLFPKVEDKNAIEGETPYLFMFGPDRCGAPSTRHIHAIFGKSAGNALIREKVTIPETASDDGLNLTHVYTLIVRPDSTYQIKVDNKVIREGDILPDWLPGGPEYIVDEDAEKPEDWDDREMIPDPDAEKPEDWDDRATIPDPEAQQPEEWDAEEDGEWEAPSIANPDYQGRWNAPLIDNPDYQGQWTPPSHKNPKYVSDPDWYATESPIAHVGIEVWQVQAGSLFDNILITDDAEVAQQEASKIIAQQDIEREEYLVHVAEQEDENAQQTTVTGEDDDEDDDADDGDSDDVAALLGESDTPDDELESLLNELDGIEDE